jgi:hypothetical protein
MRCCNGVAISVALVILQHVEAVDKSKFRTCATSGFCKRQRYSTVPFVLILLALYQQIRYSLVLQHGALGAHRRSTERAHPVYSLDPASIHTTGAASSITVGSLITDAEHVKASLDFSVQLYSSGTARVRITENSAELGRDPR